MSLPQKHAETLVNDRSRRVSTASPAQPVNRVETSPATSRSAGRRSHFSRGPQSARGRWRRIGRWVVRASSLFVGSAALLLLAVSPAEDPRFADELLSGTANSFQAVAGGGPRGDLQSHSPQLLSASENQALWRMYFATNRELLDDDPHTLRFGDRARRLRFGLATVSIPLPHQRGTAEARRGWLPFPLLNGPAGISVSSERILDETLVLESLRETLRSLSHPELLIVVHGYNVTHEAAVSRTCQIAHDLPFHGAVLAFTWPSAGRLDGYFRDENNASFSEAEFAELVGVLRRALPAQTNIHILAHSMGNRVVLGGLSAIADFAGPSAGPRIQHLMLAAPDVGLVRFEREIERVGALVDRISLYTSIRDNALVLSHAIHGEARAGQLTDSLLRLDKLQTFDVSAVDASLLGHSYYGSSEAVLNDLYLLLTHNRRPQECPWFLQRPGNLSGFYWSFLRAPPRELPRLAESTSDRPVSVQH